MISAQEFKISRRHAVAGIAAAGAGLGTRGLAKAAQPEEDSLEPLFRFAFMPDFHLRRDLRSPEGMEASLKAVMALDPKPAFIVTGGDLIHDMRSQTPEECEEMANLFARVWNDNTDLPTYHALGNHDVAGLTNEDFPKNHPLFGSNFLKEKLGLPGLNYSFDHGGWHFIVLHNVAITDDRKTVGEFPEDSLRFLREDLQRSDGMPVMLFGHYPPVTAIEFFNGNAKKTEKGWELAYGRATRNPEALIEVIGKANVRAFFSGHIHRLDRIEAKGTTFICSGSVSGDQWKGQEVDTEEGFAVIDCYADGSFDYAYHDYGWEAAPA